jgi:hypothetical protein
MKSKFVIGLLATILVLALAPSSFAQVNVQIFNVPSPGEIQTGRHVNTSDPSSTGAGILVSGSSIAAAPLTATRLILTFPAPITSGPNNIGSGIADPVPPQDFIRIEGQSGLFTNVSSIYTIDYVGGTVQIFLPETLNTPPGSTSGSFRLVGVRIDANGKTAPLTASATLSSSANNYLLSTTSIPIISSLGAGIGNMAIGARSADFTNNGAATIFTNRNIPDNSASLIIAEGFASAWRTATQASLSGTPLPNSTQIRLTFSGIPAGVTLSLSNPSTSATGGPLYDISNPSVTTASNTTTLNFTGGLSFTSVQTLQLNISVSLATNAATPAVGDISVVATMAPIGDALDTDNTPTATGGYPRFAQADVGPVTVVSIIAANTTALIPFAVRDIGFDTGIAFSNTSLDRFSVGGATAGSGNIVIDFFPRNNDRAVGGAGTAFSLTTSASNRPGHGLSADGTLAAGTTWSVLLSELLTAASRTDPFTGYIFIRANFLNGHGTSFVTDFRAFTSFSPVLVLSNPASADRDLEVGILGM